MELPKSCTGQNLCEVAGVSFSGFTFEPRLTLDGLMTLVAGVIALIAVMHQVRSKHKDVERQLRTDKEARAREEETQRHAVAGALLFEIVTFYRYYWNHLRPFLDRATNVYIDPLEKARQELLRLPPHVVREVLKRYAPRA